MINPVTLIRFYELLIELDDIWIIFSIHLLLLFDILYIMFSSLEAIFDNRIRNQK
jgi:hypothetical protein